MMWKSKGGCNRGQYDVRIKKADGQVRALSCPNEKMDVKEGIMMWKSSWMDTEGIIISKLKGWMDKGEHNEVEMHHNELKGQMEKVGHYDVKIKDSLQKGAI